MSYLAMPTSCITFSVSGLSLTLLRLDLASCPLLRASSQASSSSCCYSLLRTSASRL